jgi:hypothetical protein
MVEKTNPNRLVKINGKLVREGDLPVSQDSYAGDPLTKPVGTQATQTNIIPASSTTPKTGDYYSREAKDQRLADSISPTNTTSFADMTAAQRQQDILRRAGASEESIRLAGLTQQERLAEDIALANKQSKEEDELTEMERKIRNQQLSDMAARTEKSISAVQSQYAQSPEGATASTKGQISSRFSETQNRAIQSAIENVRIQDRRIEALQKERQRKIDSGAMSAVQDIDTQIEEVRIAKINAEKAAQDAELDAKKGALDLVSKANTSLSGILSDEFLSTATSQQISSVINSFPDSTIPESYFIARSSVAKDLQEAIRKKDTIAIDYAQAQLDRMKKETDQIGVEKPFEYQARIETLGNMLNNGIITQDQYTAGIQSLMGLAGGKKNYEWKLDDGKIYTFDPETGETMVKEDDGTEQIPRTDGKYDFVSKDGALEVSVTKTEDVPKNRRQCGAYDNDVLGLTTKRFGDSKESKERLLNSDVPTVGSAFYMPIGKNGHVGIVEKVNIDNAGNVTSIQISDMNRNNTEQFRRETIKAGSKEFNLITGYFDPNKGIKKPTIDPVMDGELKAIVSSVSGDKDLKNSLYDSMKEHILSGRAKNPLEAKKLMGTSMHTSDDKNVIDFYTKEIQTANKNYNEQDKYIKTILNSNLTGPINDLALIVGFLKNTDPNSVARESEVQAVVNARGYLENLGMITENFTTGAKLTSEQRTQIKNYAQQMRDILNRKRYEDMIQAKDKLEKRGLEASMVNSYELKKLDDQLGRYTTDKIKYENGIIKTKPYGMPEYMQENGLSYNDVINNPTKMLDFVKKQRDYYNNTDIISDDDWDSL